VLFLGSRISLAISAVVDEASNFLGEPVANLAELVMSTVDSVWVMTESTVASVHLEVVRSPGFGSVDRS